MARRKVKAVERYTPSFIVHDNHFLPEGKNNNGLIIGNIYIPEEIMIHILSNIDADKLLQYALVCRKWNNLIKSYPLWSLKYKNKYNRRTKALPWYVYYCILSTKYFDTNLLKNGNGQDAFQHWEIVQNGGDRWCIENSPIGSDYFPTDVREFNDNTSCFVSSYDICRKQQFISLGQNKLLHYIIDTYKPHIYLSEWTAGRVDCGCIYVLRCGFISKDSRQKILKPFAIQRVLQWEGKKWKKEQIQNKARRIEPVENFTFYPYDNKSESLYADLK